MFEALAEAGINIQMITTSEIKISVLVDRAAADAALRAVHQAFGLDRPINDASAPFTPSCTPRPPFPRTPAADDDSPPPRPRRAWKTW